MTIKKKTECSSASLSGSSDVPAIRSWKERFSAESSFDPNNMVPYEPHTVGGLKERAMEAEIAELRAVFAMMQSKATASTATESTAAVPYGYAREVNGHFAGFSVKPLPSDLIAGWVQFPLYRGKEPA